MMCRERGFENASSPIIGVFYALKPENLFSKSCNVSICSNVYINGKRNIDKERG